MATENRALVKSQEALASARARLSKLRANYENPDFVTLGSTVVGGVLPAYVFDYGIPSDVMGVPTESLLGGALIFASTQVKGTPKKALEGLGAGMIAVAGYKLAQQMKTEQ